MTEDFARQYLDLLKASLTASLYPESAWFILPDYGRRGPWGAFKTAIVRYLGARNLLMVKRLPYIKDEREHGTHWPMFGASMVGHKRLENIESCLRAVVEHHIPGDFVECGVWRGGAGIFAKGVLRTIGANDRNIWLADSFEGMPKQLQEADKVDRQLDYVRFLAVPRSEVEENFRRFGLLDNRVRFIEGWFSESLPTAPISQISVLRLDGDYYSSTMDALTALYDKVSPGGYIIVDDYGEFASCRRAISEFFERRQISPKLYGIDQSGVFWRKSETLVFSRID